MPICKEAELDIPASSWLSESIDSLFIAAKCRQVHSKHLKAMKPLFSPLLQQLCTEC